MKERLIRKLVASLKCTACNRHYNEEDVDIIERTRELWFLRVYCPSCHGKSLIAAVVKNEKMREAVTDLTKGERAKFKCLATVGANDMLDMHNFLKMFDGDFLSLFGNT